MQRKIRRPNSLSAKLFASCVLACFLLFSPFSELSAGPKRVTQEKAERPNAAPPKNSRTTNRQQPPARSKPAPSPQNNSSRPTRTAPPPAVRPQPQPQPSNASASNDSSQRNQSDRATTSRPQRPAVTTTQATQNRQTTVSSSATVTQRRTPPQVTNQSTQPQQQTNRQVRVGPAPSTQNARRDTVQTVTRANRPMDRGVTTTTVNRRTTTVTTSTRATLAPQSTNTQPTNRTATPRRSSTVSSSDDRSSQIAATTTRPTRGAPARQVQSTRLQDENPTRPTREIDYHADQDSARSVYLDRRRDAERATDERRDRVRRRTMQRDGEHDGHEREAPQRRHKIAEHHHRHGDSCGHHFYENRWHDYPRAHRHHDGCGHHFHSGAWISFSIGHVHGYGCGHFYDSGIWLSHTGSHHRHYAGCGHYYYDGIWNNSSCYHIHGPGCGHHYYNGRWHDFAHTHRHSDYCGHLYDGTNWLVVSTDAHIHSANCGHYQFSGRWHAYPRDYYTMGRADSLFFFVDLGDYRNRNIPKSAYDQYLAGGSPADIFRSNTPLAKAYAAFAKGRYYDSLVQFRLATRIEPDNGLIYLAKAQAQIAVKDYRAAFEDINQGMELFPEWADAYVNLSEIYSISSDLATHSQQLEDWVQRYPRDYKAHFVLGYFYYFHQEYENAKIELQYALSWDENLEPALNLMDHILAFEAESEVLTIEQDLPASDEIEVTTE